MQLLPAQHHCLRQDYDDGGQQKATLADLIKYYFADNEHNTCGRFLSLRALARAEPPAKLARIKPGRGKTSYK